MKLEISKTLVEKILDAAARAQPNECCGLIEGARDGRGWRALAVHETKNLSPHAEREFLVDPEVQFRLLRDLRGSTRHIIGCYHSHPGGVAQPSATDLAHANENGFLWLIAGREQSLGAYVYEQARFRAVEIVS